MSKKIKIPAPIKGYGYVSTWEDGTLGGIMPHSVNESRSKRDREVNTHSKRTVLNPIKEANGERYFLCEITITPLTRRKGKRKGQAITRIAT